MVESTKLNTNPEVLLKKRKNADRLRIEKQEQARKKLEEQKKRKQQQRKARFIRAETLVAKHRASEREQYRVKRVSQHERSSAAPEESDERLLFVVRIPGPHGAKVPSKARKVLELLRLEHVYTGTFIKLNAAVKPLLRLASPYIAIGTPSLATVRNLIQKRATASIEEDGTTRKVNLDDNNLIEEHLGDYGIICVEDIIHEIATLGDSFKQCVKFLDPFKLSPPVHGWGPLSKLKRLELREEKRKVNNAATAPLDEVDIDQFVSEQI
ncbi:hypothetical protein KL930_003672 [Ogataea haglerorum]|uniref:Ribosome biogenesis protein RLP7 n=1 Tax=Ogataea haglerorum TaxID=1937702 RepID=A0AAN6D5G4_9ASCO|nr:uncharacterized protein KL911_003264 [Ogataea haglerorum]KAG7695675.1 hypothetical protein KL915_003065 [Ogataea haglerorum]KAG7696004.1 hypothetical protein KL951_003529 [Ogataea haglerorum]KAG7705572.1 hypothetical protein KL914_003410 [Ogataea haglerorum]KAG7707411.1 hypothetical protein KL950_003071 [Ogataea haglerorum]KAG7718293.1 hypothetical protein KL913_002288 [Ogataea haglerorum]